MGEREVEFNMEKLIEEVYARPVLWNPKHTNNASQAWQQICVSFDENFRDRPPEEQKIIELSIRQKYDTLRECYQKEKNLRNFEETAGGLNLKRKIYVHFDKLHFLQDSFTNSKSNSKRSYSDDKPSEVNCSSTPVIGNSPPQKKARNCVGEVEKPYIATETNSSELNNIKKHIPTSPLTLTPSDPIQNEEDTQFLLSLLTEIKKIPQNSRLNAKIDILQTIRLWQTNHSQQICCPLKGNVVPNKNESPKIRKLFLCDLCNCVYTSRKELKLHIMLHKQDRYTTFVKNAVLQDIDDTLDCGDLNRIKQETSDSDDS